MQMKLGWSLDILIGHIQREFEWGLRNFGIEKKFGHFGASLNFESNFAFWKTNFRAHFLQVLIAFDTSAHV